MMLKHKIIKLNLVIWGLMLLILFCDAGLFAHPLDVTISAVYVDGKKLTVEMNWHMFEVKYLLSKHGKNGNTWKELKKYEPIYYKYIKENFAVYNNGELCEFVPVGMPEIDDATMFSEGVVFLFDIKSSMKMDKLKIVNKLFINDFRLQTNKIVFLTDNIDVNDINEIVLTSKVTKTEQWLISKRDKKETADDTDADKDLMPDRLEPLYGCDPEVWDTDKDGYSDGDEIINGWDPTDPKPGPGQPDKNPHSKHNVTQNDSELEVSQDDYLFELEEQSLDEEDLFVEEVQSVDEEDLFVEEVQSVDEEEDIFAIMENVDAEGNINNGLNYEDETQNEFEFDNDLANERYKELKKEGRTPSRTRLSKMMNRALGYVDDKIDDPNILIRLLIFLPILLLGFLHAFESGHGKTILASYLIHTKRNLFDALLFSVITAFAHISIVTLIGFLSVKLVETMGQTYNIVVYMPIVASVIMLVIGVFIIREGITHLKGDSGSLEEKFKRKNLGSRFGFLLSGFLIGIVPCPIGLGIVSWILANNKHSWLLPMMLIYGLGIFISLLLVSTVVLITKKTSFNKFRKLAKFAPLVSGIFMIISAIVIIITGTAF